MKTPIQELIEFMQKKFNILRENDLGTALEIGDCIEQAEASIALAQLSQLRDVYRQGWEPDWNNCENKFCIEFSENELATTSHYLSAVFLSFQNKETAELFLENFRDLIEKAKPLMS